MNANNACHCTQCIGAACTCGCQTPAAVASTCKCGCQQGAPCQCGPREAAATGPSSPVRF